MRLHALPSTSKSFVMNKKNGFHALPSTSNKFVMNKRNGFEVLGLASCHCRTQVRRNDQFRYPKVTIESFVGHSSMGLLCPPVSKNANVDFLVAKQKC